MKKFTVSFLILLCLSFTMIKIAPLAATVFKEGLYKASDFNLSSDSNYTIQNTSPNSDVYMLIINENNVVQQSLRLEPKSEKYNLAPFKPEYRIIVVGDGEVSIS